MSYIFFSVISSDIIRTIRDPEKPCTLEELNVVYEDGIHVRFSVNICERSKRFDAGSRYDRGKHERHQGRVQPDGAALLAGHPHRTVHQGEVGEGNPVQGQIGYLHKGRGSYYGTRK